MIRIKPGIDYASACPHCSGALRADEVLWQGVHVCVRATCSQCGRRIIEDLPIGHAVDGTYQVDLERNQLFGPEPRRSWFGQPLFDSLRSPKNGEIPFRVTKYSDANDVVIVNCIDYLYGHSLLKLLNVARHLRKSPELGIVVIVPSFLAWLVPDGVAEVWTVDLPLSRARNFYVDLDRRIQQECERFATVYVSLALSHPRTFDIEKFTRVKRHDFRGAARITYIWREDRTWNDRPLLTAALRRLKLGFLSTRWQRRKVLQLFETLRQLLPEATFGVVGFGTVGRFPEWIADDRTNKYTADIERRHCEIYARSRVVIGVHGSNMLLPSGLGGMTIDLMPDDRWGNLAQDILYQESDSRMATFRYRFLPIGTPISLLADIVVRQVTDYDEYARHMLMDGD